MVKMKHRLLFWLFAGVILACGKEKPAPSPIEPEEITFRLSASFSEGTPAPAAVSSKAVQTDWETGNVIFVFFDKIASPLYLEMKYLGNNNWSYSMPNGTLEFKDNMKTGKMRAVYLPFGSDARVSKSGTGFKFSKGTDSFYLTAQLSYTVDSNNTISGNFTMSVPANYVQFYVSDAQASDGNYKLSTDAVKPVELVSVKSDGSLNLNEGLPGYDMKGYKYKEGYLFSGIFLLNDYAYRNSSTGNGDYYFAKTKVSDGSRTDCFVAGKKLESHSSIVLPDNGNSKWKAVGPANTVKLSKTVSGTTTSYGTWYTCNEGENAPDDNDSLMNFDTAVANAGTNKILPSYQQWSNLITDLTWTRMSVYRTPGWVVSDGSNFLFFPLNSDTSDEHYWTSTAVAQASSNAWHLYLTSSGTRQMGDSPKSMMYPVRYLYSAQ